MSGTSPGDSQLSFAINPVGGERMVIPVETYSGSKQADEKRQRNAGASARFRKRKKTKEESNLLNLQRLEKDVRDMERRVQETQGENDRLRADRDRLRDLVHRTPEISYMAFQGPQSPTSSRTTMHMPGRSPLGAMASPSLTAGAPYGAADPLSGERATRRRRTESHADAGGLQYSMGQPVLPALTSPGYQTSHPGTPQSITRPPSLPPLSGLTTPPPPGSSSFEPGPPVSGAYPPTTYRRENYETGWAVAPSDSRAPSDVRRQ
ncbi:diaphanous 1 [Microdochium nivale]|nr:diaphanous 1 [Microdochium nivale]